MCYNIYIKGDSPKERGKKMDKLELAIAFMDVCLSEIEDTKIAIAKRYLEPIDIYNNATQKILGAALLLTKLGLNSSFIEDILKKVEIKIREIVVKG